MQSAVKWLLVLLALTCFAYGDPGSGQSLTVTASLVGSDGTPADLASVLLDCTDLVCRADAEGEVRCEMPIPERDVICIEHPTLGRARAHLDGRRGEVALGAVQLRSGAAVVVTNPPHLELPQESTVTVYSGSRAVSDPRVIGSHDAIEINGLAAGKYTLVLSGPGPLQRRQFPFELQANALLDVILTIDPYRLTGRIQYDGEGLEADVALQGDLWDSELRSGPDGSFAAEAWEETDVAIIVTGEALTAPYMIMRHVSPTDSHLEFEIPSRRISGRIVDADTGKGIAFVSLQVESDVEGTRATRPVEVASDGSFEIEGAGEGVYRFIAQGVRYLTNDAQELRVDTHHGDQSVDIALKRGVNVVVQAVWPDGHAVANSLVLDEFRADGSAARISRANAAGRATIAVPEHGRKTVFIMPESGSFAIATVVGDVAQPELRVMVPRAAAVLTVVATDTEGAPLSGVSLSLRTGDHEIPSGVLRTLARRAGERTVTDASGRLTIPALPPGRYAIQWRAPGGAPAGTWMPIELVAGETRIEQRFQVAPPKPGGG